MSAATCCALCTRPLREHNLVQFCGWCGWEPPGQDAEDGWAIEDPERAGPDGPRIGTIYVEDVDGHIEVRLVTRLPHPNTSTPTTFQVVAA